MLEGVFDEDQRRERDRTRVIRRSTRGRWEVRDTVTGRILGSFGSENRAQRRQDLLEPDE